MCKRLINEAKKAAGKLTQTGFFSIFMTSVLVKCIGLVGGMILTRVLSKSDYGFYTYALNVYGILDLLADMGTANTAMQLCSESYQDPKRQKAYFAFAFRWGMRFSVFSSVLILSSGLFYPYQFKQTVLATTLLFLRPIVENIVRFIQCNARIQMENRVYARINLFSSVIRYLILLPMAHLFSFTGALLAEYVIQLLVIAYSLYASRRFLFLRAPVDCLTPQDRKDFFRLAFSSGLNNVVNNSLILLDVFLLGIFIQNEEILASYKVASAIPTALLFIPSAVETYMMPYFARRNSDALWIRRTYRLTVLALSAFNLLVCAGSAIMGPSVMVILYGNQYGDAYTCFMILMAGYFFASIRSISFIAIYTQRKVNINVAITLLANVANIVLDIILIQYRGSVGAALASAAVNFGAALCMVLYLEIYLKKKMIAQAKE